MGFDSKQFPAADIHVAECYGLASRPDAPPASAIQAAVVTMTLARDPAEAQLLQRSLQTLAKAKLPIYVGEGGSLPNFVEQLRELPLVRVCPRSPADKPTLVNQLRTAFARAQEVRPDYALYTEPDKREFFGNGLPLLLNAAQPDGEVPPGLVLAARTRQGFATFPEGQRIAEGFMNKLAGEALGRAGDYTYGPMLIHHRLLRYTQLLPEDLGWGWRFFMLGLARQLRMRIDLCVVPSQCPPAQRNEDDGKSRRYRLRQLTENVTGLANGWTCLLDPPGEVRAPSLVVAA